MPWYTSTARSLHQLDPAELTAQQRRSQPMMPSPQYCDLRTKIRASAFVRLQYTSSACRCRTGNAPSSALSADRRTLQTFNSNQEPGCTSAVTEKGGNQVGSTCTPLHQHFPRCWCHLLREGKASILEPLTADLARHPHTNIALWWCAHHAEALRSAVIWHPASWQPESCLTAASCFVYSSELV
jgi:hypothetical protein